MNIHIVAAVVLCIGTTHCTGQLSTNDLHYSFWADYNQFNNKPQVAMTWYNKLLSKKDLPGYRYKGLLHLFKRTNNLDKIISFMPSLEQACCNDTEIQLLFAQSLQEAGKQEAADQKIMALQHKVKDNLQVAFQAAQIFMKRKEPENALLTIKDYIAHAQGNPNNFIFHFLAAQAYLSLNKKKEAIEQLAHSVALNPNFDKGWLLYALLNEQENQITKAIEGYTNYLQETAEPSPQIQEHLLRLAFKQKLLASNREQISIAKEYLDKLLAHFKERRYKEALRMINEYKLSNQELNTHPELNVQLIKKDNHILLVDNGCFLNAIRTIPYQKSTLLHPFTKWYSKYKDHYATFADEPLHFIKTQAY